MSVSDSSSYSHFLSWVFFGTKLIGGLLVTLTIVLYANQERILYIPNPPGFPKTPDENPPGWTSPNEWTVSGRSKSGGPGNAEQRIPFEEKFVSSSDGVSIHTWLLLQPDSDNAPTLIYFHGNAGNMGFRLKNAARMYAVAKVNVLMMDYRGYGSSQGTPTEKGLNLDADAVLEYATSHPKLKNSPMILFGRSLGGAVAVSLAHRQPTRVAAVFLENTFLSVSDMVDALLPAVAPLKHLVLTMHWDSFNKIKSLTVPLLFIAGDRDELVPHEHMLKLHAAAQKAAVRDLYVVKGGTHNSTWERGGSEYYLRMLRFIEQHLQRKHSIATAATVAAATTATASASDAGDGKPAAIGGAADPEEEDYYIIGNAGADSVSLPTMGTDFQVRN